MTSVTVEIRGSDLPGKGCGPRPEGGMYEDIYVALKRRDGPVDFVPGDAPAAQWELDLVVRRLDDDELDFTGPFVYGRRGERALGLVWGTFGDDDEFDVFRAAKLRLSDLDPDLVERAMRDGGRLVCSLGLTDEQGHPRCASVRPPDVAWSVAPEDRAHV